MTVLDLSELAWFSTQTLRCPLALGGAAADPQADCESPDRVTSGSHRVVRKSSAVLPIADVAAWPAISPTGHSQASKVRVTTDFLVFARKSLRPTNRGASLSNLTSAAHVQVTVRMTVHFRLAAEVESSGLGVAYGPTAVVRQERIDRLRSTDWNFQLARHGLRVG